MIMSRHGQVIRLKPGKLEEYRKYHAKVWPGVLDMISKCNIRNYSIYHRDGFLYAYFEYTGRDFKADMAKMAADPTTQEWWAIMNPLQQPVESRAEGEWWAEMDEVFHTD
jgi:L-rhamnose mutarotase